MTYSRIASHTTMLFDTERNRAYATAISKHVRPGSQVMDLGAGLGIHGLLAAAAGARKVYLVEPQPVVHAALEAARAAGLAERIEVVQARVEEAALPERVDVIVSVFVGNLLFSEDLLPSLLFARDRYLKPGGALLPHRAQLWLAPIEAAALHHEHIGRWSDPAMGFDYSFARPTVANDILWLRRADVAASRRLAPGCALVDLDLASAKNADCRARRTCIVEEAGTCHGLLGWVRMQLDENWISSDPAGPELHWSPVVLPLDPPLPVSAGEPLDIQLVRPAFGDWSWAVSAPAGSRRHSTFLARSEGARELGRVSPGAQPGLSAKGERARRALELLALGRSNDAVARDLAAAGAIPPGEALREVQALALKYGRTR